VRDEIRSSFDLKINDAAVFEFGGDELGHGFSLR